MNLFKAFEAFTTKQELINRIDEIETMILIYSDRDQLRVKALEKDLHALNMELLDIMSGEVA